jgi:hypothetical protein
MNTSTFLEDLDKVSMQDIELVGGKNASLGEMLQNSKRSLTRSITMISNPSAARDSKCGNLSVIPSSPVK